MEVNPLAGLWFAVRKEPALDKQGLSLPNVVWMFQPNEDDVISADEMEDEEVTPISLTRTRILQPPVVTQRINAQHGWFSIHKLQDSKKKFTPFERNSAYRDRLTKFSYHRTRFHLCALRLDLDTWKTRTQNNDPQVSKSHSILLYVLQEELIKVRQSFRCFHTQR